MEIRNMSLLFPETEGEGPVSASTTLTFPRRVRRVAAGVSGYSARFEDNDDHHVGRLELEVSARVHDDDDTKVLVKGVFGLRDWSNEWDDPYSGVVDITVLAELAPVPTPQPGDARGDLLIVDTEISQVIQHFRSADHLAAPNVFPDNSIREIAEKPTVVRLYTDYDQSSGLPLIGSLSGELIVEGNGSTTTIAPVENMIPRRDVSIDRGNRSHTLNFFIPENLCRGTLTLRGRIFDAFDPTQFSQVFTRDISFDNQPPLPIMAVGINYTGDDVKDDASDEDLKAPVESDFVDVFEFTETLYPIPEVEITSYQTIDYGKDTISDISEGCDKLDDMKDAVGELRGDSDDIVYGLFNRGVDTGSVGGCGGGGVGVGRIGNGGTAAHEIGHALGRKHAPCDNVTRCAQPLNTDGNYPDYSGYDSDSIGEYGVNPRSPVLGLKDPSQAHDFMGYSPGDWVSPYTYKALMGAVPTTGSGGAFFARSAERGDDSEWIRIKQPKLFLRLDIDRDGAAVLDPSFHYAAHPRPTGDVETDYSIQFLDEEDVVLSTTCLYSEPTCCACGCDESRSHRLRIRQAVSFPGAAKKMQVLRCDETVDTWEIPYPPEVTVEVDCEKAYDGGSEEVTIRWDVQDSHNPERKGKDVEYWALVQWRDRWGNWRGAAPRTRENEIRVPRSVFGPDHEIHLRVLITSGIATGVAEWRGPCGEVPQPGTPDAPEVVVVGVAGDENRVELQNNLRAAVVGRRGGATGKIRWHDSSGGELARGRSLDLRSLPIGQTTVSATLVGGSQRVATSQWLVERTSDNRFYLLRGDQHPEDPCAPPDEPDDGGHEHPADNEDDVQKHPRKEH